MLKREFSLFGKKIDLVETSITGIIQAAAWVILCWLPTLFIANDFAKAIVFVAVAALGFCTILMLVYGPPWISKKVSKLSVPSPQGDQANAATLPAPPESHQEELLPNSDEELKKQLLDERATARRWEYAYLNYYLVLRTQFVLDWLYAQRNAPPSVTWFRSYFVTVPEPEQRAVLDALSAHFLIGLSGDKIESTGKGCECLASVGIGETRRLGYTYGDPNRRRSIQCRKDDAISVVLRRWPSFGSI